MVQQASAAERPKAAMSEQDAQRTAVESGAAVEVLSLRGERTETVANPDGTFTTTEYVHPVRTRKNGQWAEIDTTLVKQPNGTYAPEAALAGLSFSGGGDQALAAIESVGRSMSLAWPSELPAPAVEGSTATYAEVFPGVDLQVRAAVDGFSHLLVVKTPEAAASPELANFQLPVETTGVEVRADGDGGLEAVDATTAGVIFEAPAPIMWDSSHEVRGQDSSQASAVPSSVRAAWDIGNPVSESQRDPEPPEGAQVADVGLSVQADALVLTPDANLLKGDDTVYPVYIDPAVKTASRTGWTMVSSHYSTSEFWKFSDDEGVGRCPANVSYRCSSSNDVKRQFFAVPTGFFEGKHIVDASFAVTMVHTYDDTGKSVELARVNSTGSSAISSSTNWSNQPSSKGTIASKSPTNPAGSCTSTNQNVRFDVRSTVQKAANSGWDTTTFRLKAGDEGSYAYWKRFCGNAHLEVTYNRPPYQPLMSHLTMSSGGSCEYGAAEEHFADEVPTLTAIIRDPDHGDEGGNSEELWAEFRVFWTSGGTTKTHYAKVGPKTTSDYRGNEQVGAAQFKYKVGSDVLGDGEPGFSIPQNVVIGWDVRGHDGTHFGPRSSAGDAATRCEFVYDATKPKPPVVTSASYPDDGAWHDGVGDYGSFTLDSPSSDVVKYKYRFTGGEEKTVEASTPGGPANIRFMPDHDGPFTLQAKAIDGAGHEQETSTGYVFLVGKGRAPKAAWSLGDAPGSSEATGNVGTPPARAGSGVTFGAQGPHGPNDPAASLDGTPNGYLGTEQPVVDTDETFSVGAWIYLPEIPDRTMTVVSQDGTAEPGFALGYDEVTKSWSFRIPVTGLESMGSWKASGGIVRAKTWTHLIGVYDGDEGKLRLYVNGMLAENDIQARRTLWKAQGGLQIGRELSLSGPTAHLKGTVADVKLYDRVIAAGEGHELGGLPAKQLAYWGLDEAQDGVSPDWDPKASGDPAGLGLTLAGDAAIYTPAETNCDVDLDPDCAAGPPVPDALWGDGHLTLDGVTGHATRAPGLQSAEGSFTATARVRLASLGATRDQTVLALSGSHGNAALVRYSQADDRWQLELTSKDGTAPDGTEPVVTTAVDAGALPSAEGDGDHLALVYDAVFGGVRLYVNGQLAGAQAMWRNTWDLSTTSLQVGRKLTGTTGGEHFSGAIDEVRVYQGALDSGAIGTVAGLASGTSLSDT
ncbi:LamG-like jellyroll fold domain-containing protein [Streptomyces sp. enrichment culture]|uniref:LamG-like jellyroll fold domain-containing protein n=1 Tax=Streptomyces sp. enrichment culture TaxID=1795815 RepID=UPI003F5639AA